MNFKNKVHILMGLPGSGKSYFCSKRRTTKYFVDVYVDLDNYRKIDNIYDAVKEALDESYIFDVYQDNEIYIDGLITTPKQCKEVMRSIYNLISKEFGKLNNSDFEIEYIIEAFKEDRDACINNDKYRMVYDSRKNTSESLIKNAPYEIPSLDYLKKCINKPNVTNITINEYDVYKINSVLEQVIELSENGKLYSNEWITGGRWGDCWGNEGNIEPDESEDFYQLDNLLEVIAPNLTFLQYKKIEKECVELDEWHNFEYYGGVTYKARYECDLFRLQEQLKEMGYGV